LLATGTIMETFGINDFKKTHPLWCSTLWLKNVEIDHMTCYELREMGYLIGKTEKGIWFHFPRLNPKFIRVVGKLLKYLGWQVEVKTVGEEKA